MNTRVKIKGEVLLSTLWVVVMINVAMADIFQFMMAQMEGGSAPSLQVPIAGMFVFAIIMEIPIAMIILSRVLGQRSNRLANTIASIITIAFVLLGGSANLVYGFFADIEISCLLLIIWFVWKWS